MAELPATQRRVVLARVPTAEPVPDDFDVVEVPLPRPGPDDVVVRTLYLSIDAGLRGRLSPAANYTASTPVGEMIRGSGIVEVVEAGSSEYRTGELLVAPCGWQEYSTLPPDGAPRRLRPSAAPITTALGALGQSGFTAWVGMVHLLAPQAGETVVVSTAAGAVGSVAGQLAKVAGARTVGICGSAEKVARCVEEFGYDVAIDYSQGGLDKAIAEACPGGVDAFFDNVGAEQLDAVLANAAVGARVAICGTLGLPTGVACSGPRMERTLLVKRARVQGFIVSDHWDRWEQAMDDLHAAYELGSLRFREDVTVGLERAPEAFAALLAGKNTGKSLVAVGVTP